MNRRVMMGIIVGAALAGVFIWFLAAEREPSYNGRSLGEWCEMVRMVQNRSDTVSVNTQAVNAIRAIGTNAIPWLLKDLQARGSPWHYKMNQLLNKQAIIRWRFPHVDIRLSRGIAGFQALGELGTPAVPELERILTNNPGYVPAVLVAIGHNAVPALCRALTNEHPYVPSNTAAYIANYSYFGCLTSNDLVVLLPLMKQLSKSTNSHWASRARGALQTLQANGHLEGELARYRPD